MVANHTVHPGDVPAHLEDGKVYLLDGRQHDVAQMENAIATLVKRADHDGVQVATYGELR